MQQRIAECLRTGLPLAGLISTLLSATGCDKIFAPTVVGKVPSREEHVVGDFYSPVAPDEVNAEKQAVDGENNENPVEEATQQKADTPPLPPGAPPRPKTSADKSATPSKSE